MAFYDTPGLLYDSGVLYDSTSTPQQKGKKMAKVKLGLSTLNPEEVVAVANTIKTAMTGNANFSTSNPTLASVGTQVTTTNTKIAAYDSIKAAGETALAERDLCANRFKDFQFGLKLIAQNSGQQEFVIDADAVRAPDKVLSDWVVASYRKQA